MEIAVYILGTGNCKLGRGSGNGREGLVRVGFEAKMANNRNGKVVGIQTEKRGKGGVDGMENG